MNSNFSSSDGEERRQPRKRQRTSKEDSETKKSRGRPRLDPHDETAAERRRTQIRLAQRAYRQRKETTISALKSQVSELQETINEMKDSFLRFNDTVMHVGVPPEVVQELKSVTQQFISYAKAQGDIEDEEESVLVDNDEIVHNLATEPAPPRNPTYNGSGSRASSQEYTENIGLGYRSVYDFSSIRFDENPGLLSNTSPEPSEHDTSIVEPMPDNSISQPFSRQSASPVLTPPRDIIHGPHLDAHDIPYDIRSFYARMPTQITPVGAINDMDKNTSLTSKPFVYSFQETTFARRLQRASVECGYHLIAQAHLRPKVFKRVFKLSLLYGSREQIAARFRAILTKSTNESLEFWQTPMIQLGGAGTHYPRRNEDGTVNVPPNSYSVEHVVPGSSLIQLKNVSDGSVYCDMLIDITGYEGEWFDPTDVEGYLESKGIYIDPQSSFADAQIPENELPELARSPQGSEKTLSASNPTTPLLQDTLQVGESGTEYSYLSTSFFNEFDKTHSTSFPTETQDPFNLDFDPSSLTTEAIASLSKPHISANTSSAPANNTTTTTAPRFGRSTTVMAPPSLLDTTISAFVDNFAPPSFPLSPSAMVAQVSSFDPVDFDNMPLDEQNSWGLPGIDLYALSEAATTMTQTDKKHGDSGVPMVDGEGEADGKVLSKRQVTIDVTRLIEELLKGGVCLGRAPGFRKKDVDRALEMAMIAAY
ncbi:MAG: hypothetical protein M1822_009763 [Bathelium mastoideum]|nr:MAG: hypothetical protein M1822_009763 [Bathelium mastoideum]